MHDDNNGTAEEDISWEQIIQGKQTGKSIELLVVVLAPNYVIVMTPFTIFHRWCEGRVCGSKMTQPASGGAITADTDCCANCVETSRPQQ